MDFWSKNWRQLLLIVLIAAVLALTATSLLAISDTIPLLAALAGGIVAFSINETVQDRRSRESEEKLRDHREEHYQMLIEHILQSFTGGPKLPESEVRRRISMWGSKNFLEEYSKWRTSIKGATLRGGAILPEEKPHVQRAAARVCIAAREDLKLNADAAPTDDEIASILFDDYTGKADI